MSGELIQTDLSILDGTRGIVDWQTMIDTYLNTLETESTRQTYAPTLRRLPDALGGSGPAEVSAQDLAEWARLVRDAVEAEDISPNYGKLRVMAVKSFFRFAYQVGQSNMGKDLRAFVLKSPKEQVVKPFQVLSAKEQGRLLGAVEGQERRILATLLYAGLRVSELCKLRAGDYYADEEGRPWLQVRGKGSKVRTVPVGDSLGAILGAPKSNGNGSPIFPSREGNGYYSRVRIFQMVQGALVRAGIDKRISPHSLRHTAAMAWIKAGVPLPVVQQWLGHASLATTQKYLDHFENGEAHQYMP